MADVLLLSRYDRLGASSRVRSYQYLDALAARGIDVDVCPLFDDEYVRSRHERGGIRPGRVAAAYVRRLRDILRHRDAKVIWLEYELLPWLPYSIERMLVGSERAIVADYDDAVFHRYDSHANAVVRALLATKIDRVMSRAGVVIAGNDYLAKRALAAGAARVEIVPSVIDLARYRQKRDVANRTPFTIGWIGSPSTTRYLRTLEPVLRELNADGDVRLVNVGGTPWSPTGLAVENRRWSESTEVSDMLAFDVGVMPLPDEPWARGKCGFKLVQYMGCGLPIVASPVGANATIVEHGRTGYLASTDDDWVGALRALAADAGVRERMGRAGYERVRAHYSLAAHAPRVADIFANLLAKSRPRAA